VVRARAAAARSPRAAHGTAQLLSLLPQVRFIARRIHRHLPRHVPIEDLYQAGVLGLLDALRKFDPRRRVRFESYMKFRIRGAILDELRSLDWSPRELRRKARRLEEAHQELCKRLGREPSRDELAEALRISVRQLESLRNEVRGLDLSSLQEIAVITDDGVAKDRASLVPCPDSLGPQAMFAGQQNRERLAEAIELLPENERRVLTLYYYEELTMKEVGEVLALCESRVSQIHSSALARVRAWLSRQAEGGVRGHSGSCGAVSAFWPLPPTAA
jgi:RNA polymerase sigma factor for flagellar operon FliA